MAAGTSSVEQSMRNEIEMVLKDVVKEKPFGNQIKL